MQPFLQNSTNRDLRKKVYMAYINRGDNGDKNDTNATIAKILKLRADRAKLLGLKLMRITGWPIRWPRTRIQLWI